MACRFDRHPSDERWEEYALGLLSEEQIAELEEHLLVCPDCQDRLAETDAFIYATREAARRLQQEPPPRWRLAWARLQRWGENPAFAWGVAAAAVLVLFLLVPRVVFAPRGEAPPPLTVMLYATRSSQPEMFAQAPAGRALRLGWDPTGLPADSCCRVEVVDASGRVVAGARVSPTAQAELMLRPLPAGTYWVRLYAVTRQEELLREFGLKVR